MQRLSYICLVLNLSFRGVLVIYFSFGDVEMVLGSSAAHISSRDDDEEDEI